MGSQIFYPINCYLSIIFYLQNDLFSLIGKFTKQAGLIRCNIILKFSYISSKNY